jgi:hypothetical protein
VMIPLGPTYPCGVATGGYDVAGDGTISGFTLTKIAVPMIPTTVETKNPVFDRSMRYHKTGLTSASVSEACEVDSQGSLR